LKELDAARNRNAWYASELELARKGGYVPNTSTSPALEVKPTETFDDEDRPLIEALLAMRTELANVQSAVDKQAVIAARQIAEAEKQRDAAIQEAVYAKARMAAHNGGSASSTPQLDGERDEIGGRSDSIGKKLAAALHLQKNLYAQIETKHRELEAERRARQLADETSSAADKRLTELEAYKQQTSAEVERVKSELHLSQREAREHSVSSADAVAALALLKAEKEEITTKYNDAMGSSKNHDDTFVSLRSAIKASEDAKSHMEKKLAEERSQRELLETKYNKLKSEHEARTAELVASTQRLRDAEELAETHANEARTHRHAVLSGLDKISARDMSKPGNADNERLTALQNQVTAANALVKKYQQEADSAADKLRSAEERIAGLEQYQEQSSREGVSIRRQLQAALKESQSLQAAHSDLKNQLSAQQLETNAMTVQHNALKDILSERGISPTAAVRTRNLASPRTTSPEQTRLRELEARLSSANQAHEETKQTFAVQAQESESAYREKLTQLENDYQSAVHYVKGTEKMLKQLKEQLSRYKSENSRLKSEMEDMESRPQSADKEKVTAPSEWEEERGALQKKVNDLQEELRSSGSQLEKKLERLRADLTESNRQRDHAIMDMSEASKKFSAQAKDLEQFRSENSLLEQRATDAEQKVALLLDQVEHSVDSYRRRSRQAPSTEAEVTNGLNLGHTRDESSEVGSVYGGNGLDARNSAALDNLASELETLRSHWEATNKNYRLSTNFDLDSPADAKKGDDGIASAGLSESLADWRKKLDAEESNTGGGKS
jgi:chromosome segregation ATPase